MYVAPPSSEYCSLDTATSSVADRFSVCGDFRRQLLLPSGVVANAAVPSTGGAVSAAIACGTAARPSVVPAAMADTAAGQRLRLESLMDNIPLLRLTTRYLTGLATNTATTHFRQLLDSIRRETGRKLCSRYATARSAG